MSVRWIVACVVVFAALGLAGMPGRGVALVDAPIDIGSRRELFVDRFLVENLAGCTLVLQSPRPAEIAVKSDRPWEGWHSFAYTTVVKDGPTYRMYYRGTPNGPSVTDGSYAETTCYAESSDGIHWTKPDLGLFEVMGTKQNNVILAGMPPFSHNFAPIIDTRPGVAPAERWKALAGSARSGLVAFASGDGIRWRKMREQPVITKGAFDSQNVAFWSESEKRYVSYFRIFKKVGGQGVRWVSRAVSDDFLQWSEPVEMTFGDAPVEHLYTNQTLPYFRAPHQYIALAARFMSGRQALTESQLAVLQPPRDPGYPQDPEWLKRDCSETVLLTSRGGTRYDRTFMEGFIKPGLELANWVSRSNYPSRGIVPTGPGEISIYVGRHNGQPTAHIQRLTLRTDGFAALRAPYAGGEATTKLVKFTGRELEINYSTSAAGSLRVELLDEQGRPLPGFARSDCSEIVGDEIERVVTWSKGSDLGRLAGKPVRLKFVMKDAELYAFRFR
jgi:hypothetical protein